jgi:hypothetical protein
LSREPANPLGAREGDVHVLTAKAASYGRGEGNEKREKARIEVPNRGHQAVGVKF